MGRRLPPPLPPLPPVARRVPKPPPLPKRVIAYVTSIEKNNSTAIWSVVAVVIAAVGFGVLTHRQTVVLPAREARVAAEVARFDPIRQAVRRANFAGFHPLTDSVWFKRMYIQNDLIVRYQVNANYLRKKDLQPYISFIREKPKFLALLAADVASEEALRLSSSIYVDVYDANDEYLYSYDLRPSHIWPGAVDPEAVK